MSGFNLLDPRKIAQIYRSQCALLLSCFSMKCLKSLLAIALHQRAHKPRPDLAKTWRSSKARTQASFLGDWFVDHRCMSWRIRVMSRSKTYV